MLLSLVHFLGREELQVAYPESQYVAELGLESLPCSQDPCKVSPRQSHGLREG